MKELGCNSVKWPPVSLSPLRPSVTYRIRTVLNLRDLIIKKVKILLVQKKLLVYLFSSNSVFMLLIILLRISWVPGLISCKVMGFSHVYCYGCPQHFQANSEISRKRCLSYPFEFIFRKHSCYLIGVVEKSS